MNKDKIKKIIKRLLIMIVLLPLILIVQSIVTLSSPGATKWMYSIEYNALSLASKPFIGSTYKKDSDIKLVNKGQIDPLFEIKDYKFGDLIFVDSKKVYYFYNEVPRITGINQEQKGLTLIAFDKDSTLWDQPTLLFPDEYKSVSILQKQNGELVLQIEKINNTDLISIHITDYGQTFSIRSEDYYTEHNDMASMQGMKYLRKFVTFTETDAVYDPRQANTNEVLRTPTLRKLFLTQGHLKVGGLKVEDYEILVWSDSRHSPYEKVHTACDGYGCTNSASFSGNQNDLFIVKSDSQGEWGKHIFVAADIDTIKRSYYNNGVIYFVTSDGIYGDIVLD